MNGRATILKHIAAMDRLEYLELSDTKLSDAGLSRLASLVRLRTIDLHGSGVTIEGMAQLREMLPGIRWSSPSP